MTFELASFARRLRGAIAAGFDRNTFESLALELFALQFAHNPGYRRLCEARRVTPATVEHGSRIPAVPTAAFKELEMTALPAAARTTVFHSSGTTEQKPSRHFHCAESLAVYEASLWSWFQQRMLSDDERPVTGESLVVLTPPPDRAPHSSLVHMFETVRRNMGGAGVPASRDVFLGRVEADGAWSLDFEAALTALEPSSKPKTQHPKLVLGTAFSLVHLLEFLAGKDLRLQLPPDSRVMETGGYKGRSRALSRTALHALITERLGVPPSHIVGEYGMSELSSQAYDGETHPSAILPPPRVFRFPPWARVQIVSPETGLEVADGQTGLIRVFDLANVFSVMAVQTDDLGVRRGGGFALLGRAAVAEPRGCSLMAV
jgi:hypothetical protein